MKKHNQTKSPKLYLGDIHKTAARLAAISRNPCSVMADVPKPFTIDEAVKLLVLHVQDSGNESSYVRRVSEYEFERATHLQAGEWIRNNWELTDPESQLAERFQMLGVTVADDMSRVLLRLVWRSVNGWPHGLDEMIQSIHVYWKAKGVQSGIPEITKGGAR